MLGPDGKVGHAELQLGESLLMLADEVPQLGILGPKSVGGTTFTLNLYVEDVDEVFDRAIAAGAESRQPPKTSSTATGAPSSWTRSDTNGTSRAT